MLNASCVHSCIAHLLAFTCVHFLSKDSAAGYNCRIDLSSGCTNLSTAIFLRFSLLQYDNRAEDLTKGGMRQGIIDSGAFILFLSAGILSRPVRRKRTSELRTTKRLTCVGR